MTAYLATPKPSSLAGRAASRVSVGDRAASGAASCTAASDHGSAADARTPFYDHLMSMIDETAVESGRVQRDHQINAAALAAAPRWRLGQLLTGTAGLVAVLAVGGAVIEAGMRARQPTVVAADPAPEKESFVVAR